jgi:hypothetical protein
MDRATPSPISPASARSAPRVRSGKLDARTVQQIRDGARIGYSQRDLAAHFGLSQSTVSDLLAGRIHSDVPDVPASALRPARATEPVRIEGVPYRERLFALLADPLAGLEAVVEALGAFPGITAHHAASSREIGCRGEAGITRERTIVTSKRGALELVRTTDARGSQWSAPWLGAPPVPDMPRLGPAACLARLQLLEVLP